MLVEKTNKTIMAKQEIETVKFNDIFSLYKVTTTVGEQVSIKTGICENTELEDLKNTPETFNSENTKGYYIFKKETPEIVRTDFHEFSKNFAEYNMKVLELMNNIENLGDFSDYVILKYDTYTDLLYEYGKETAMPKSIYFDYINGCFSNEYYNLEECLTILKSRTDIKIFTDKHGYGRLIQDVPYYNQNENNNRQFIDFVWQPTQEDWEKVVNNIKDYNRCETILKKVFKFERKE